MIFVYIRIFMVVYDRENLIKKFHEKNYQMPAQLPLKVNQNGLINKKTSSESTSVPADDMINHQSHSCNLCSCFSKPIRRHPPLIINASLSCQNHHSKLQDKSHNHRYTNQNSNNSSNPLASVLTKKSASTIFRRPCSFPIKKATNLEEEISNYRRNLLSGIGAEYQFRTGDSPCYEKKTFVHSLPSLNKRRSHSLEHLPSTSKCDYNVEYKPPRPMIGYSAHSPNQFASSSSVGFHLVSSST